MFVDELLDFIFRTENNGIKYDDWNSGYEGDRSKKLTDMTIAEVLAAQKKSRSVGGNSAAGAGQIIYPTLNDLVEKGVADPSERFSIETQRRLHKHLLNQRGLGKYMSGQISALEFGNNLAKEYAALPLLSNVGEKRAGKSYYGGDGKNRALTDVDSFKAALSLGSPEDVLDNRVVGTDFVPRTPMDVFDFSPGSSSSAEMVVAQTEPRDAYDRPNTVTGTGIASIKREPDVFVDSELASVLREDAEDREVADRRDRGLRSLSMAFDMLSGDEVEPMPISQLGLYRNVRARAPLSRFGVGSLAKGFT